MDTRNLLSRRSMLKASSFFAAAALVPTVAGAADEVPEVLSVLLAEYVDAQLAEKAANEAYQEAKQRFERALNKNRLYLPDECGAGQCFPWLGHFYAGSVDPWTANHRLTNVKRAALLDASADELPTVRRLFRNKRRLLARQLKKYRAIELSHGLKPLDDGRTETYHRAHDVQMALQAYRPTTFEEVRAIAGILRNTPSYRGTGFEWILSTMLGVA